MVRVPRGGTQALITMSLKAFHIIFVVVSMILCLGFGLWALVEYRRTGDTEFFWGAGASLVGIAALLVYGRWFLRKVKWMTCL